jgi:ATP-dependent DNA helicase RecQ
VVLARPRVKETTKRKPVAVAMSLGPDDTRLFEVLRELRKRLAAEAGVPPYVIFGDAALLEMSRKRPRDEAEFLEINGVGQVKLARYGSAFLEAIARAASE